MPINFSEFLNQTSLGDYISIFFAAGAFTQLATIAKFGLTLAFFSFLRKEKNPLHKILIVLAAIVKTFDALQQFYEAYVFQQGQEYFPDILLGMLSLLCTAYFFWHVLIRK